jgi:arylsulfatase A-like enzyme
MVAQEVTVFLLDDVGRADVDRLIADGRAPSLRKLVQEGFQFRNAHANPICQPSRRSLDFGNFHVGWTGRICLADSGVIPAEEVSLAERVPARSALFGKWHEGAHPEGGPWALAPQGHGWHNWRAGLAGGINSCGSSDYFNWNRIEDGVVTFTINAYQPAVQFSRWLEWRRSVKAPRLALFSIPLAHAPYHRPPRAWLPPDYPPTPTDRSKFEAMIVACDVMLARVLARMGPDDVLVLTSDNGTPGNVIDSQRAKGTTFERGINIPLVFYGRGIERGSSATLVHLVDVHATVAELLGAPADASIDSRSLVSTLRGGSDPVHEFILCGTTGNDVWEDDVCVRSERYKLRRFGSELAQEEFYDLAVDPLELSDRSDDPALADTVARHRAWLEAELPAVH